MLPNHVEKENTNTFFKHPLQTLKAQSTAQNSRVSSICSSVVSGNMSVEELVEYCSSRVIQSLQRESKQQCTTNIDFQQASFLGPEKKSQWGIRTYGALFVCFLFAAVFFLSFYDNFFRKKTKTNLKNTSKKFFEMRSNYAEKVD